MAGVSE